MPSFSYSGRNMEGQLIRGQLDAENTDMAAGYLMQRQIVPIEIKPTKIANTILLSLRGQPKQKKTRLIDLIFFSRQMYTLLKSGIPILSALNDLGLSTPGKNMRDAIREIQADLSNGHELSVALRHHPAIFPPLFASIIEVGESSGNLDESFQLLASYLEKERELSNNIRSALRYPLIVIGVVIIAIIIINIMVIPAFTDVFNSFNTPLPLMTRILIGSSNFMLAYWHILLGLTVPLVYFLKAYLSTDRGRWLWHKYKLKLPLVGEIIFKSIMGRFSHTLAMCIKTGIPWNKTFTIVSKTTDNDVIAEKVIEIREAIEQGISISQAATECGLFPPLVLQMIHVGEQTGSLDKLLADIGEYYEREVAYQTKTLNDALEPLLLWIVGIIVLILALGVFLPMWDLGQAALSS